jgi:serine/threonine protein kinase
VASGRDYLGNYRYVRLIRAGATCQVWEVAKDADARRVAIKVLQPEHLSDKEQVQHLRHEYDVGRSMHHPNVVEIYDYAIDRSIPYLVLELINGKNLKLMLRNGVESLVPHMAKIIEQSAEGLKHFHDQGWVHRDVKPDNFLVTEDWNVKLIDFAIATRPMGGLSKLFNRGGGKAAGTRSYMSPEQIRNEGLDVRADLYSYGCTLFELVTGKLPFTGITSDDLLGKHLRTPPPALTTLNTKITTEFNGLVMSLMAKNKEDRPKSMEEFLKLFRKIRIYKAKKLN